jgi:hypothetical protein
VARFVSLGRGTARVEIVEADRDRVTVIVIDAA